MQPVEASARASTTLPALFRLAWPIVISRSSQAVVGVSDALMVAPLGAAALAATTTGAMNAFTLFILPMGTVFIVASFASQYFGKGDLVGARRYAFYGLIIAALTEALALLSFPIIGPALSLLELAPDVRALMHDYLRIRIVAAGAVVAMEALASYFGGVGNTRVPMVANLVAMVLNVFLNWLLIYGALGAPELGVVGAAWASLFATAVACAGLFIYFLWTAGDLRPVFAGLRRAELWKTLRFGLPAGLNWFFEFFAFLFFVNVVVAGLGTTALAAMMAVLQLNSVAFMPAFALASAGAILVGQAIGADAKDEVPRALRLTFLSAGGWQLFVGLVYLAVPALIFAPFAKGDSADELMAMGVRVLMLSAAWQLADAAAATLSEALRAAGDTAFPMWARLILSWALFVPGAWLSVRVAGGGVIVALLWVVAYLSALSLVLYLRFARGTWRRFDLTETI